MAGTMSRHVSSGIGLASVFTLSALFFCCAAHASAPQPAPDSQDAAARIFAYEAVTIKPDNSGNGFWKYTADGFTTGGMAVNNLIRSAFNVLTDDQIIGLPAWAKSEPLTIQAKMDADTAATLGKLPPERQWKERQLMMQSLLGDRFALKAHHATKDLPTYELVVAKTGSKLKRSASETGGNVMVLSGKIDARAISMQSFAANLSLNVGRVVVDKTDLKGGYDFAIEFAPEGADASDPRPSLFTVLEEQLGLKLVPSKDPVDVIVIDHIERPTEN
jgi:bla regulator protein blaR1